ncbi:hypothetical protein LV779_19305 [Streptomyces thinghirensis]|nr:hypothetical protein [Streptomyces thinghirensis]
MAGGPVADLEGRTSWSTPRPSGCVRRSLPFDPALTPAGAGGGRHHP